MRNFRKALTLSPRCEKRRLKPLLNKKALVLKPYFKFILRQKPAICVSITAGFISCLNCKIRYSKLLRTLKTRFFDEFQGKKVSNPDGLRAFLTQKGAKNMFLRQCCLIEEWLKPLRFLLSCFQFPHSMLISLNTVKRSAIVLFFFSSPLISR